MSWKHELAEKNLEIMKDLQVQALRCFDNKDYINYKKYMTLVSEILLLNSKIIFDEGDK